METDTHRDPHVRSQARGLRRNQPPEHPALWLPALRTVRKEVSGT